MKQGRKPIDWEVLKQKLRAAEDASREGERRREQMARVYEERARDLLARKEAEEDQEAEIPFLVFRLGREAFALDLALLKEVVPLNRNTPIPLAPRWMLGLMNLRGELRCVLDPERLMDLTHDGEGERTDYVLLAGQGGVGLRVGLIEGLLNVKQTELAQATRALSAEVARFSKGIIRNGVNLLDLDRLLAHPALEGHVTGRQVPGE